MIDYDHWTSKTWFILADLHDSVCSTVIKADGVCVCVQVVVDTAQIENKEAYAPQICLEGSKVVIQVPSTWWVTVYGKIYVIIAVNWISVDRQQIHVFCLQVSRVQAAWFTTYSKYRLMLYEWH